MKNYLTNYVWRYILNKTNNVRHTLLWRVIKLKIGLAFIVKTFDVKFRRVAEHLGIRPTTIADWVKGRRKIPVERCKQLSEYFGLKEEYFQKELSREEEIEIQKEYVVRHSQTVEYVQTRRDDSGEEYSIVSSVNDSQEIIQLLNQEQKKESLFSDINQIVQVDNGQDYNLSFFQDLVRLIKDDRSRRLVFMLIGSMSRAIGNTTYGLNPNEKEAEFTEDFKELLLEFGYKERYKRL